MPRRSRRKEKLIRDNVPIDIFAEGKPFVLGTHFRIAEPEEMTDLLIAKLREETDEVAESIRTAIPTRIRDELCDVYAVLDALAQSEGLTMKEIAAIAKAKAMRKGEFLERFVLFLDKE